MLLILKVISMIATVCTVAGLVLRVALLGLIGAVGLRLLGVVDPQHLPSFWLMLGLALFLVAGPAWAGGHDEARRQIRDAAIRRAEREYQEGR